MFPKQYELLAQYGGKEVFHEILKNLEIINWQLGSSLTVATKHSGPYES